MKSGDANAGAVSLASNVFPAAFSGKEVNGFDYYLVEGITSQRLRHRQLGDAIQALWNAEHKQFASFTPSKEENYVVGYLGKPPTANRFNAGSLTVTYAGQRAIPLDGPGRRTITELLNKTKRSELRRVLWSTGRHFFYPKEGEILDKDSRFAGSNLIYFRGPFFRYNVLSDGRIVLTLDSSTHYVRKTSFLQELKSGVTSLDWLSAEIDRVRREMSNQGKSFFGVHFYYALYHNDVAVDGVDPRPISSIPLSQPQVINGVECRTIAQYLRAKYRNDPQVARLDESQPGLVSRDNTYAPQFMHMTVDNKQIPFSIQNEFTNYMDTVNPKPFRDVQRPAKVRAKLISEFFLQYNFQFVDLGPVQFKMGEPLTYPITNHFEKPRLLVASKVPVEVARIEEALRQGLHRPPSIRELYLYCVAQPDLGSSFYDAVKKYTKDNYGYSLPVDYLPLETDYAKMRNQLAKAIASRGGPEGVACLAVIPKGSGHHRTVTNTCGELRIPSKCFAIPTAEKVLFEGRARLLGSPLASFLSRAGAVPWILHDKLHFGCYVAVDVGRSRSEEWAMSVVFNNSGEFTIKQGGPLVGEDLNEQAITLCVEEASRWASDRDSLVYLRDGEVFESERTAFENAVSGLDYKNVALVSVKETVPYRIFRRNGNQMLKPLSGDYYFLDESTAVLCAAGVDEYKHGMPKPIVAEIDVIKGAIDRKELVEDMFKLSFLNWGSPGRSYSTPAPLRLAHKAARELGLGLRRFGPPF